MITLIFFTQLLCAMVPCDPNFSAPEIETSLDTNSVFSGSRRIGREFNSNHDDENIIYRIGDNLVETIAGKVKGFEMKSMEGKRIHAFEGIPYAEPPVGFNRFRPPVPKTPWTNIFPALKHGHPCLQFNPVKLFRTIGREDCLTVNVYSSQIPTVGRPSPNLPVLVWIHGGAYLFGEGAEYGPSYLLNKDIVLVTLNYRLGILGFLSTADEASPGNNGLKDQALAIKWIHENIAKFGGDPGRVTLIGHSAGGSSAHLHMMSNSTKHFQSAISLSGTAMNCWAVGNSENMQKYANKIAKLVNCPPLTGDLTRSFQTVDCFRRKNANMLVSHQMRLLDWGPFPIVIFGPVVETPNPTAIITESPKEIYARDGVAKIPWVASYTKEEGLFQLLLTYAHLKIPELRSEWTKVAPFALDIQNYKNRSEIVQKVHEFYYRNESMKSMSYNRLSDPITDRFFVNGIHKSVMEHSAVAPTYAYIFDFLGKHNVGNYLGLRAEEWGIGHTEDVFYIFNSSTIYNGFSRKEKMELELSHIIVNLLTNFADKGVPVYTDANGNEQAIWTPVNNADPYFLQIGRVTKMIPEPFKERREFWESLDMKD